MNKNKILLSIFLVSFITPSYAKTICVDMDMHNKESIKYSLTVNKDSDLFNEKSVTHITKYNQSVRQIFDITDDRPKEMNTPHFFTYDYLKETDLYLGFSSIEHNVKQPICDNNMFLNQQKKTVLIGNNISATFRLE